jgi:hypothetical protein
MRHRPVLLVAAACLCTPIVFGDNQPILFASFVLFELCVGLFWPAMGYMRGIYVPENGSRSQCVTHTHVAARATTMNFFRIPLNMIVVVMLSQDLHVHTIFTCCVAFLTVAAVFQHWLYRYARPSSPIGSATQL